MGRRFSRVYGLDEGPNFSDPHHDNGAMEKNVLFLAEPDEGLALVDKDLEAGAADSLSSCGRGGNSRGWIGRF